MKRLLTLGVCVATLLLGCGNSIEAACEKTRECSLPDLDVEMCTLEVEDRLEDRRVSEEEVDDCVACIENNTCGEINTGDCTAVCTRVIL